MPRPRVRGTHWSLNQVRTEAGISRGHIRALVAAGWLAESGPYLENDIVLAQVGHQWMTMFPHRHLRDAPSADTARRLTYAAVMDPSTPASTVLVGSASWVQAANDLPAVVGMWPAGGIDPVVVLPLGAWIHALPSHRSSALRHEPDPLFPSPTPSSPPGVGTSPGSVDTRTASSVPTPTGTGAASSPRASQGSDRSAPEASAANPPIGEPMSAYARYTAVRDDIIARAEATRPQPYASPGEPW